MCENCQQYLYQFLNDDFKNYINNQDDPSDSQFNTCYDFLTEIYIYPTLYNIIYNFVREDFNGSNQHDIDIIVSFIALGVIHNPDEFFYVFVHFVLKHDELFYGIVYHNLPIQNTNKFPTEIYKYCFEKITILYPNSASEA